MSSLPRAGQQTISIEAARRAQAERALAEQQMRAAREAELRAEQALQLGDAQYPVSASALSEREELELAMAMSLTEAQVVSARHSDEEDADLLLALRLSAAEDLSAAAHPRSRISGGADGAGVGLFAPQVRRDDFDDYARPVPSAPPAELDPDWAWRHLPNGSIPGSSRSHARLVPTPYQDLHQPIPSHDPVRYGYPVQPLSYHELDRGIASHDPYDASGPGSSSWHGLLVPPPCQDPDDPPAAYNPDLDRDLFEPPSPQVTAGRNLAPVHADRLYRTELPQADARWAAPTHQDSDALFPRALSPVEPEFGDRPTASVSNDEEWNVILNALAEEMAAERRAAQQVDRIDAPDSAQPGSVAQHDVPVEIQAASPGPAAAAPRPPENRGFLRNAFDWFFGPLLRR